MLVNGELRELLVAGVPGGTVEATNGDQYVLPFYPSGGSGQSIKVEGLYEGTVDNNES